MGSILIKGHLFSLFSSLSSHEWKKRNLCSVGMGCKGPWVLIGAFCNVHPCLQEPYGPPSALWLFMTYGCLQGHGPHFLLKCKHIPLELGKSLWNSLSMLPQDPKFSEKFIQKAQTVQKHRTIFSTSHGITVAG